ncbi:hypothetical protein FQR65_LT07236 [Abscondita terminalis]|nr:hypothetical protein FQR65_LT07236 [Abscondita terminalis]
MANIALLFLILMCGDNFTKVISVSNIIPESLSSCEEAPDIISLTNKDVGNDEKSWTGEVNIPFEINQESEFTMDFRWYKDGELEKQGKMLKGKACYFIEKFASGVWKQIKNAAKPSIEADCTIQPGKYEFVDFVPKLDDVFLPIGGSGRANAKITITKDDKTFCAICIADLK